MDREKEKLIKKKKRELNLGEGFLAASLIVSYFVEDLNMEEDKATEKGMDLWFKLRDLLKFEEPKDEVEYMLSQAAIMRSILGYDEE